MDVPWEESPGPIHVVEYTDPYSVWCWGCEPVVRRLEYLYPDRVTVDVRMGGLFEDFGPMREYWTRMSGGRWKESVRMFLTAVAAQHRMPSNPDRMIEGIDDFQSTWPACIAVKAAQFQGRELGRTYLRRLREASIVEGRPIHDRRVQTEVAAESGLDRARFAAALDDGSASEAFRADLEECRSGDIVGFPTFLIRKGMIISRLEGYHPWEAFDRSLQALDPELRPSRLDPHGGDMSGVLRRFGHCATQEVAAIFSVNEDEAEILLEDLEAEGRVVRHEIGDAVFWDLPATIETMH